MKEIINKNTIHAIFYLSLSLVAIMGCGVKKDSRSTGTNVLLIMVDDLNTDLGCYGNDIIQTPNIDRLASEGITFYKAYCQLALCKPSRASLLTGLRPNTLGITSLRGSFRDSNPDIVTLPQLFRENGYYTARVGKIFHMGVPDGLVQCSTDKDAAYSWDESIDCMGYELNSNGYFYNATPWEEDGAGMGGAISWLKAEKGDHLQHDYNAATKTIALLSQHRKDPFFIACGFIRPHVPLVAPKRYFDRYDLSEINLPERREADWNEKPEVIKNIFGANFHISKEEHRRAIRAYYACVTFVDDQVGRLMNALDSLGLRDDTHVVFVRDHGVQNGEHGLWFKKHLFNESVNAPLIISSPTHTNGSGRICDRLVEFVDIFPTVTALCQLSDDKDREGISLVPLLENPSKPWKRAVFTQTSAGHVEGRSVRTARWCYNEWGNGEEGSELYDLKNDPYEFENLVSDQDFEDTVKLLKNYIDVGWTSALPMEYKTKL